MTTNHYVYRYLDAEGNTLYVGCTTDLARRERQHKAEKAWFPLVASVMADVFVSRDDALAFEKEKIEQIQPPHNQIYTERARKPRHMRREGVSYVLPKSLVTAINAYAAERGINKSAAVQELIERGLQAIGGI